MNETLEPKKIVSYYDEYSVVKFSTFPYTQLHIPTILALCKNENSSLAGEFVGRIGVLKDTAKQIGLTYMPFSFSERLKLFLSLWISKRYTLRQLRSLWRVVNMLARKLDAILMHSEYVNQLKAFSSVRES